MLAQTYYPMPTSGAQWRIKGTSYASFPPTISADDCKMVGDTVIGAQTYHTISKDYNGISKTVGFREQNMKIYGISFTGERAFILGEHPYSPLGEEYLLMDFNAAIGTKFIRNTNDTLVITSISNTEFDGFTRLQYNLQGVCLYENWVAGIGVVELGCFEYLKECIDMLITANTDANRPASATVRLYPNPTYNRQFRYELSGGLQCSMLGITNLLGQTVFTKNNPENDILLPENLRVGLYSVVFYTNKGRVAQKIVVME